MEFNINQVVRVKLTDVGIVELHKHHDNLIKEFPNLEPKVCKVEIDDDGYTRFQLHVLMSLLGHLCVMGGQLPFHSGMVLECE